jgi:uncharacterized lipoprotein YmbA
VFVASLALAGCSMLEPRSDPTRLYLLTSDVSPAPDDPPAAHDAAGSALGLGPIALPAYLARPELVRRGGGHEVVASAVERWGEPLEAGVVRVLAEDLVRLAGCEVVKYPWLPSAAPALKVAVEIGRFEAVDDAQVELFATLRLARSSGGETQRRREEIAVKLSNRDGDGVAAAMSSALAELARRIVALAAQSKAQPGS